MKVVVLTAAQMSVTVDSGDSGVLQCVERVDCQQVSAPLLHIVQRAESSMLSTLRVR